MIFLLAQALAWDSVCLLDDGERCANGYQSARHNWVNEESEHQQIMLTGMDLAGLPSTLNDPFLIRTFADDTELVSSADEEMETIRPVLSGTVAEIRDRRITVAEMAQLPDFSWSLWDWISGNEYCTAFEGEDPETCHIYNTHMGALNSSHFSPQNRRFNEHYHQLALERAAECLDLGDQLAASGTTVLSRFEHHVLACEKEALVLESVAQHYLQDAWSSGHMWERWGGPELSDFDRGHDAAKIVAPVAGLIHGARAVVEQSTDERYDDPLCAPHDEVSYVDPLSSSSEHVVGDLYWTSHLESSTTNYPQQYAAMFGCMADGMRTVYAATGQYHGSMDAVSSERVDTTRSVSSATCWDQRVTNAAMAAGWDLHIGESPDQVPILEHNESAEAGGNKTLFIVLMSHLQYFIEDQEDIEDAETLATLRMNMVLNTAHVLVRGRDPAHAQDTDIAEGNLWPVLDAAVNSRYERGGNGNTDDPPASYLDPSLPWTLDGEEEPAQFLNLGFADAHASDRCELPAATLTALQSAAISAVNIGSSNAAAACGLCIQMAAPLIRIGNDANDYDADREPLCHYTSGAASSYVYTGTRGVAGGGAVGARSWCGCEGRLAVLNRTPGDSGLGLFEVSGEVISALPPGPTGASGEFFSTNGTARGVAVGGPFAEWAYVVGGDGLLYVYDLADGGEHELDGDWDPDTTDDGAPDGVTRVDLGAYATNITLMHSAPYGLVATDDGLVLFDTEYRSVVGSISSATLGMASGRSPQDIAITHDDKKAFVSAYGSASDRGEKVMVIDLERMVGNGLLDASVVLGEIAINEDTGPYALSISHDGTMLAIALRNADATYVVNTSDYSTVGVYYEYTFLEDSVYPSEVVWSPNDDAVFVGYVGGPPSSTVWGNGSVRRCYIAEAGNCEHGVAVKGDVRSLVVVGEGDDLVVWAADGKGNLTALRAALFEPGKHTGLDQWGLPDGSGGCLGDWDRAEACEPTLKVGGAGLGGMALY